MKPPCCVGGEAAPRPRGERKTAQEQPQGVQSTRVLDGVEDVLRGEALLQLVAIEERRDVEEHDQAHHDHRSRHEEEEEPEGYGAPEDRSLRLLIAVRQLTDEPNLVRAARKLLTMGPRVVVAKQGEYGSAMFTEDGVFGLPAYPTEDVVDPTGAGDTFAGGFMAYLARTGSLDEDNIRRAMVYGAAMGSYAVEQFGIRGFEQVTLDDVERRVRAANDPSVEVWKKAPAAAAPVKPGDPATNSQLKLVEDRLRRRLQTDVSITVSGADKGTIKLGFYSPDDLERLLDIMLGPDRSDFD